VLNCKSSQQSYDHRKRNQLAIWRSSKQSIFRKSRRLSTGKCRVSCTGKCNHGKRSNKHTRVARHAGRQNVKMFEERRTSRCRYKFTHQQQITVSTSLCGLPTRTMASLQRVQKGRCMACLQSSSSRPPHYSTLTFSLAPSRPQDCNASSHRPAALIFQFRGLGVVHILRHQMRGRGSRR
jgi:hypothetical protein